ncbi:MAG: phage portal protein, partial [Verrucomicrobiota bacterium]
MSKDNITPGIVDKAIALISPRAALSRMQSREALTLYGFDGARHTNQRKMVTDRDARNDSRHEIDRVQLMREARDVEDNFPIAGFINRKYASHVAPTGYQCATGDDALNKKVENFLNEEWFPHCDFYGRFNFFELAHFAVTSTNRDGDHGWNHIASPDLLQLQPIEADLLGNPDHNSVSQDYVSGIQLDEHGRPALYKLYRRVLPGGGYTFDTDVEPINFIHFLDPRRVVDYRGVTRLASAITSVKDLRETLDAVRMQAKKHASITSVVTGSNGFETGAGDYDAFKQAGADGGTRFYESFGVGKTYYTNDGE